MIDFSQARANMVSSQVRPNKVTDPDIIDAMAALPRERFVPKSLHGIAYADEDLPLGGGRFLLEPMVLARLVQAAGIGKGEIVLDVGCATGYSTALMARLANTVVGLESESQLAGWAGDNLRHLGIDNAVVNEGALTDGYPAEAPYDVIFVNGAVAGLPAALADQLAEGGRLVAVQAAAPGVGRARLWQNFAGQLSGRDLFDAATPYLPGFEPRPRFVF